MVQRKRADILGIDISKKSFNVALLRIDKYKHKKFSNDLDGFKQLRAWLDRYGVKDLHGCMESTSVYWEALAEYLYDNGYKVSVVNPARIKGYAQGELIRSKTDKVDASVIARFCRAMDPGAWIPEPKEIRELRSLVRRLEALDKMRQQEVNRLDVSEEVVKKQIRDHIEYLSEQIETVKKQIKEYINNDPQLRDKQKLLDSIPGVGEETISQVLSHFGYVEKFPSANRLSSYLGISPREYQSGSSVRGRSKMSKIGRSSLRKTFFMPALASLRFNPVIREMKERMERAGKPKMVIVGAAMRKLVHLIYGVLKTRKPFDPNYCAKIS